MIKHLACVMDGNRRWAKARGLMPWDGHAEGVKAFQRIIDYSLDKKIPYLTLYMFSIENFKRSEAEKKYLFTTIAKKMEKYVPEYNKNGVQIKFIGDRSMFPKPVIDMCNRVEEQTANNSNLILHLLFCYGGQQEIVAGVKTCIEKVQAGELNPADLDISTFKNYLWSGNIPDPDIVIRTGGCSRLSNFLLFQVAYSQLYFPDIFWPELTAEHVDKIMESYHSSTRTFGQ